MKLARFGLLKALRLWLVLKLALTGGVFGAENEWTWLRGDTTGNRLGVYGSLNVAASGNKPGSRLAPSNWTSGDVLWLFGGDGYGETTAGSSLNDLWSYDPTLNQWTWRGGSKELEATGAYGTKGTPDSGNWPGARRGGMSATDSQGNLWLFGGLGKDGLGVGGYLGDLWRYDSSTGRWTWIAGPSVANQAGIYGIQGTGASGNYPGAREDGALWADSQGRIWLFGGLGYGETGFGALADLWSYDPVSGHWTWMGGGKTSGAVGVYGIKGTPAPGNRPGGRYGVGAAADGDGTLWLFGGLGYGESLTSFGSLNDLWKFDVSSGQWTWITGTKAPATFGDWGTVGVPAATNSPSGRLYSRLWIDAHGRVWMHGGEGIDANSAFGVYMNDFWIFDPNTDWWTWMKGSASYSITTRGVFGTQGVPGPTVQPGGRVRAASWLSADGGSLFLFGGEGIDLNNFSFLNDLFRYEIPEPSSDSFAQWVADAGLSGVDAEAEATPFDDGVANLLKFAFNMNGTGPDRRVLEAGTGTAGLPAVGVTLDGASSVLRIEFVRRKDGNLDYAPQKSGTLEPGSWMNLTDTPTLTAIDQKWERVVYEEIFDATTTPRLFGQVRLTLLP